MEPFFGEGIDDHFLAVTLVLWNGLNLDGISSFNFAPPALMCDPLNGRSLVDRGGTNDYVVFRTIELVL